MIILKVFGALHASFGTTVCQFLFDLNAFILMRNFLKSAEEALLGCLLVL